MSKEYTFCMSACDNWKCSKKASYSVMRRAEQENAETYFQLLHKDCDKYIPTWATKEIEDGMSQ